MIISHSNVAKQFVHTCHQEKINTQPLKVKQGSPWNMWNIYIIKRLGPTQYGLIITLFVCNLLKFQNFQSHII